jgi:AAA domain, putative AbiEii toxin, Type IV TA system
LKIRGDRTHLSVTTFEEVDLPALAVLVGVNGSGKSQFLQAIEMGSIATDLIGPAYDDPQQPPAGPHPHIVRIEHGVSSPTMLDGVAQSNLTVQNIPHTMPHRHYVGPEHFDILRASVLEQSRRELAQLVGEDLLPSIEKHGDIWRLGPVAFAEQTNSMSNISAITELFKNAEKTVIGGGSEGLPFGVAHQPQVQTLCSLIKGISDRISVSPFEVVAADIEEFNKWGSFKAFDPNVIQVLGAYRDAHVRNDLKTLSDRRSGNSEALSDDDFRGKYGRPPWEAMSEVIQSFGLGYRVSEPPLEPTEQYGFVLKRLDTDVPISFSGLSSGEKVLLRFALSLFRFDPLRVSVILPRLLLLDEMDASLHPEMLSRWLESIKSGLIDDQGIHCVLTTHSPTTVALAPEDSLFEIVAGDSRPRKVTKQQALNKLTVGLPTLAFDYAGRRQVFVESSIDAAQYERIISLLKAQLNLPRSLTFISAGMNGGGDARGGCTVVTQLVSSLTSAGVTSLYGLVDWDGKNKPDGKIKVLGHGTHYTKENLLLDPLLVSILLMMDQPTGVEFSITLSELDKAEPERLQQLCEIVISKLGLDPNLTTNRYLNNAELSIPERYNTMPGHNLEQRLLDAFPSLNRYSGSGKHLTDQIVDRVLANYPQFCPAPLAEVFREIGNEDNHQ